MSCGTGPGARPASDWPEVLERASRYGLFKDLVAQIPRSAPLPLPTRSISIAASREARSTRPRLNEAPAMASPTGGLEGGSG
jgi:hypothetical protein